MQKKNVMSMVVVALLLIGVMATSVLASNLTAAKTTAVSEDQKITATPENIVSLAPVRVQKVEAVRANVSANNVADEDSTGSTVREQNGDVQEVDVDNLRETVPSTYEETDERIGSTQRFRFILYTNDGAHVMWGFVGNGHFVGTDNNGKRCWGIYGNNIFAGMYDGQFFWGKYRSGNWKAEGLFGLNYASGKYVIFRTPTTAAEP